VDGLKLPSQNCPTNCRSDKQCKVMHCHKEGQFSLSACVFCFYFFNRSAELSEGLEVCVFIDSGSSLHEVGQQNTMLIPKHRRHDFARDRVCWAFNFTGECVCFQPMFCCLDLGVICDTLASSPVQLVAVSVTTVTIMMATYKRQ
jgi:hypothetical protein